MPLSRKPLYRKPLYRKTDEIDFELHELPELPLPRRVLMADPRDFCVEQAINPHMLDEEGRLRQVDRPQARSEWKELGRQLRELGLSVEVLEPQAGLTDLVFCANQALPVPAVEGLPRLVPGLMAAESRRGEVALAEQALARQGYRVEPLTGGAQRFEGTGDGLWHPKRRLLWAGVGPRSEISAWVEISERYALPVVVLELSDALFYHLDTCLALLDEGTCLWHPPALTARSRELVEHLIPKLIECAPGDARLLAANALCPDGRHVLIQKSCEETSERLRAAGFEVLPVATDEFLKSGGSVFCMKLLYW